MPTIIFAAVGLTLMLLLLGAIVRFSIVSPVRTRGARERLGAPDGAGVERVCGFPPPASLVEMYRDGRITRLAEFSLVDTTQEPNKRWFVGGFYPLTSQDVLEQRRIHGITTGIPIADDMDKGVYFVTSDGRIMFRAPGHRPDATEVAPSVEALSRFQIEQS